MRLQIAKKPKFVIGIDPGDTLTGIGIIDLDSCTPHQFQKIPNAEVRDFLLRGNEEMANFEVAMEEIVNYGGVVGKTVFTTVEWIGRYKEFMEMHDIKYTMLKRKTIVTELCGNTKATDKNVRDELIDIYGEPGTKKKPGPTHGIVKDMWSALAIATAYSLRRKWISI